MNLTHLQAPLTKRVAYWHKEHTVCKCSIQQESVMRFNHGPVFLSPAYWGPALHRHSENHQICFKYILFVYLFGFIQE